MVTHKKRQHETQQEFAARMGAKIQYGESNSRNRVYLHPDDWARILTILRGEEVAR